MGNSSDKLEVKCVAYFDLITSTIALVTLGVLAVWLLVDSHEVSKQWGEDMYSILWMMLIISFGYVGIVIWMSILLLQAVKEGTDKAVALRKAKSWRNVNLMFLVLGISATIKNPKASSAAAVILRAFFLLIVWSFIAALKDDKPVSLVATKDNSERTENDTGVPYEQLIV